MHKGSGFPRLMTLWKKVKFRIFFWMRAENVQPLHFSTKY